MKPVPQRVATRRATFMTPASFSRSRVILPNETGVSNDSDGPAATPAFSGQEPRRCVRTACGWARARDRSDVGRLERRKDILRDFVIILSDAAYARKRLEHRNPRFHLRDNVSRADGEHAGRIADAPTPFGGMCAMR